MWALLVMVLPSASSSKASRPVAPISLKTAMASRHFPGVQCRANPSRKRISEGLAGERDVERRGRVEHRLQP